MSGKRSKPAGKSDTLVVNDPDEQRAEFKDLGGSKSDSWNRTVLSQTAQALWLKNSDQETRTQQLKGTVAALGGINPQDELEGMMAAQLIASHNAAMECYRRAMISDQTFEGRRENLNQANKLSRSFATLVETLNRHRGKGQQKVTVEHVHIHAGGQAVVGMVGGPGGGDRAKTEELPHAKQIADAPDPALPCTDKEGDGVPIPGNGKRSLPDARRKVARTPER